MRIRPDPQALIAGLRRPRHSSAGAHPSLTTRYPLDSPPSPSPSETPLAWRNASVLPAQFVRRPRLAARLSIAATPSGLDAPLSVSFPSAGSVRPQALGSGRAASPE